MKESKGSDETMGHQPIEVRYRMERSFKAAVTVIYVIAYFFFLIGLPMVIIGIWQQAAASSNRSDLCVFLLLILMYCFVLFYAFKGLREYKDITGFEFFRPEGFTYLGDLHIWKRIECVYMNPYLDYLVLLFKGPGNKDRPAGYCYFKKRFEPSLGELMALLETEKVPVSRSKQFTAKDLVKIKEVRSTSLDLDWIPP